MTHRIMSCGVQKFETVPMLPKQYEKVVQTLFICKSELEKKANKKIAWSAWSVVCFLT